MKRAARPLVGAGSTLGLVLALAACSAGAAETIAPPTQAAPSEAPRSAGATEATADQHNEILSEASSEVPDRADLVATRIERDGDDLVFHAHVVDMGDAGAPDAVGALDGAPVWSYVWPTSLNSSTVGFEGDQGILALAATSHPDFDDTPLYDEDGDGVLDNDGATWHAHWVVLGESAACPAGLSVVDIPEGTTPTVPETWPGLPLLLDSPDLETWISGDGAMVRVPVSAVGDGLFSFDGVTAGLRVSTSPHDPLLCVEDVWDVASGDLSLPGTSPAAS